MINLSMEIVEAVNGYYVKVGRFGTIPAKFHEEVCETRVDALGVLFAQLKKEYEREVQARPIAIGEL